LGQERGRYMVLCPYCLHVRLCLWPAHSSEYRECDLVEDPKSFIFVCLWCFRSLFLLYLRPDVLELCSNRKLIDLL
jgi:hypothetical protein